MKMMLPKPVDRWLVVSGLLAFFLTKNLYAYRPFSTEDAGVAGKGVFQTELSYDFLEWKGEDKENVFLVVAPIYGISERVEFSAEIPYLLHNPESGENEQGLGDINLVLKTLLKEETKTPALVVKVLGKMSNGSKDKGLGSGDKDLGICVAVSKTFGKLTAHSHFGYVFVGDAGDPNIRNIYLYGLALDWQMNEKFNLVGEIAGCRHPDRISTSNPLSLFTGFVYKFSEKFIFDFALKFGLTDASPEFNPALGVSVTY